ncbi:AfsR/SARP family transcriptional regulator [Plantactinospora soyae]|uniref:DNA-binding SARP family transcriptional activator/tetratricopeptide (TPR) repeat protein n=1 Tax=Plantactinospora soyae TaxID=1544732 RepID=A0A927LZL1_9ACTN|nr:AfsR/SARP family transcriptional regulator [Plantactinospora soyae]MBE1485422.1 DNA-binding SARP family transcriptional activator/tetratricopeptide (TPR) repeat protein [Plantactinospora soyae]
MKFGVLGPLRVCADTGAELVLRSRHQRTVLGVLLVGAGEVVTVDRLVEALWTDRPPASYASNLQTYVSRLRDRLPGVVIEHRSDGYLLRVDTDDVDVLVFRREVAIGRAALAAGDPVTAAERFRRGLRQWRGRPLADLSVPTLEPELARWELERVGAQEDCVDADLAADADLAPVLAELHRLVTEQPLRERPHGQLMVALCRAGRRAEALAAYQHARETLVTELGIEPGAQLRGLHQAVLRGEEPSISRPNRSGAVARSPFPVCQLPPALSGFVGRTGSLHRIEELLRADAGGVPVVAVSGQPGVGKSALAVVTAHRLRARFPDGQLFVNLTGASAAPRDPAAVLADLLRVLGVPGSALPQNLSALAAAYRARLADRRVLVVLDDAATAAQVRPLLPGTPGSAVLTTSRRRLSGLIDARHLPIGPLTDEEARALLAHVVGSDRVAEEPGQAARIAAACGNLPLAVRIAGTRLVTRSWPLAILADRLDDERQRLDELAAGDQQVRASLALSVQALPPATREAFGLLGSLGPVSFASWAVAELLDHADVDRVLDELVEASLLEVDRSVPGAEPRYRLHDLLRVYAEELAGTDGSHRQASAVGDGSASAAGDRPASAAENRSASAVGDRSATRDGVGDGRRSRARRRVLAAAIALAGIAARGLPRTLTWARLEEPPEPVRSRQNVTERIAVDPVGWLTAELDFLLGLLGQAWDGAADREAIVLARRLAPFLWVHGHWTKLQVVQRLARQAAERCGDDRTVARTEFVTGVLRLARGDLLGAAERLSSGRARFERLDDRHGLACLLSDQAVLHDYQNQAEDAARTAGRAVELFRAEGDPLGALLAAPVLSAAYRGLGRLDEALEVDRAAVEEAGELGAAEIVTARCLNALAVTRLLRGEPSLAYAAAERAVDLLRTVGDRYVLLAALRHLASAAVCLGRRAEAVHRLQQSHDLAVQLGDRPWATGLARDLAVSWIGEGRAEAAVEVLRRCAGTFEEMSMPSARAATLAMLARAYDEVGNADAARDARFWADILSDPRDTRTPALASIVLRLADAPGLVGSAGPS